MFGAAGIVAAAATSVVVASRRAGVATAVASAAVAERHAVASAGRLLPRAPAPTPSRAWAPTLGGTQARRFSSGWNSRGMYGGSDVDPTHGRARWHKLDISELKNKEKPIRGQLEPKEYDEQHGRWWHVHKEHDRPKLYTTIGRHARKKGLKRTIVRWVYGSPNLKKMLRDPYRKRWPKGENIGARFFAEFCLRPFEKRPLLETAHTLPLYGVGCKFWRGKTPESPDTKGQFFMAESAMFKLRPIRGLIRGTQYVFGRPVRSGIAPVAKTLGSWRYEPPEGAHPAIYRPAFPKMSEAAAADQA